MANAQLRGHVWSPSKLSHSEHQRQIEGYVEVIEQMRAEMDLESLANAELQKKVSELHTALEEKELEGADFLDEVQQHIEELSAQVEMKTEELLTCSKGRDTLAEEVLPPAQGQGQGQGQGHGGE